MQPSHARVSRYIVTALVAGCLAAAVPALGQVAKEDVKLLASDGAAGDRFGRAIAIDNDLVAVGAWWDDDNGSRSGSAYVLRASTGEPIVKLLPNDGAKEDFFGWPIALDNGIVAVGAFTHADNGPLSGAVYLFDASTGTQIAKLLPSDGAKEDFFGYSLAIDNGIVAVGAPKDDDIGSQSGSAYLFDASTGVQLAKLLPSDGAAGDRFGVSIAIEFGFVAVGAFQDDDHGSQSGSAYVFSAATGAQIVKLLPRDGAAGDQFGNAIDIDNGIVAVAAYTDADNGSNSGSAYLFNAITGGQIAKLIPSDGAAHFYFGNAIAISNGLVAVASVWDRDNGSYSGSAYLFDTATGAHIAKLLPSDGARDDQFGRSIAIDNGVIAVGAYSDDTIKNGSSSGSAYVFDVNCRADLNGDFTLDFFDVALFLGFMQLEDPVADFNADGVWDFFDVAEFLVAFAEACP